MSSIPRFFDQKSWAKVGRPVLITSRRFFLVCNARWVGEKSQDFWQKAWEKWQFGGDRGISCKWNPSPLSLEGLFGNTGFARYYWGLDPHSLFCREVSGSYGWAGFHAWQPSSFAYNDFLSVFRRLNVRYNRWCYRYNGHVYRQYRLIKIYYRLSTEHCRWYSRINGH
jgi:hypothetical protein